MGVSARHEPLYSAGPHTSTISASADGVVDTLAIHLIKGKMSDCSEFGAGASMIPCRTDAVALSPAVCAESRCSIELQLEHGDLVTYFAVAKTDDGTESATTMITYGAGVPDSPIAIPNWWHTDSPPGGDTPARINLALFRDTTYAAGLDDFAAQVTWLYHFAFFNPEQKFSHLYTASRHQFDLWTFPFDGPLADPGCYHQFGEPGDVLLATMEGSAILHDAGFRDCSSLTVGKGGKGTVDVTRAKKSWLLVHESGHFLFGLADEYAGLGQEPVSMPPNTFNDQASCETHLELYENAECNAFGYTMENFRVVTIEPETMGAADIYSSEFRNTADAAVRKRLSDCLAGDCSVP